MSKFIQGELFGDPAPAPTVDHASAPTAPPPPPSRTAAATIHFLGWDRPVVDSATDYLFAGHAGQRLVDLSDRLVIVPTQHAGRRLREALATRAAESDGAVVPPLVVPPEFLISPSHGRPHGARPVAGNAQVLLVWADVLRQIDLEHFRQLFPVDPVERSFSWAIQTAGDILSMRKALGEAGLTIADAAAVLGDLGMEPARWRQLAALEQRALNRLDEAGIDDLESARRQAASGGRLPAGLTPVTVIATPDPTPLVIHALQQIAAHTPVEIAIHAPRSEARDFDSWGRPSTKAWSARQVHIPDPPDTIHLSPDPASQAELVAGLVSDHAEPVGLVAIGVPDEETIAPIGRELDSRGFAAFNPSGEPLQHHEVYYLLRVLGDLVAARPYSAFAQLVRCPDFIRAAAGQYTADTGMAFDHLALLKNFDSLQRDHLPDTLEHTAAALTKRQKRDFVPEQSFVLTLINRWLTRFEGEPLGRVLPEFLTMIYSHRGFQPGRGDDRAYTEISAAILGYLDELDSPISKRLHQPPGSADLLSLLLQLLASQPFYPDRDIAGRPTIDLQGWLELLWEDAPHLIVTGFNEGRVPDSIIGDAYLPNRARSALEIRDNDHRLARDAYYLTALIESRRTEGRVDLIVGKTASDSSPLSPSRLLFLCPDEQLPARARQLFSGSSDVTKPQPAPWARAWKLRAPPLPADAKIRHRLFVTQFSDYLSCPFRFFLKHGLGMEEYDREKLEMDHRDFGNLCHDALEQFGRDESVRDSTDYAEIRNFLVGRLDRSVTRRYGGTLTVPILIQLESAKQRLDWAARIQAEERSKGWAIEAVEWSAPPDPETALPSWSLDGMPISFKIDRIDRHETTGELRVLDYKTSDRADSPEQSHLKSIPRGQVAEDFPGWSITTGAKGKPHRWSNLQLPLYIFAMRDRYPGARGASITTGLFKLPKAASETRIDLWEDLTEGHLQSARKCVSGVIECIRQEIFWPPSTNQMPAWDPFKKLFFGDPEAAVLPPPKP